MKCDLCKKTIDETFLNKIIGTYIRVDKKQRSVCRSCQKENSLDEVKKKL
tara:strand:+ start:892 stop:1041 length:150 start_codon:yes stop_codon:yes gene_type:complete